MNKLSYISPILKDRKERIKIIKEAMNMNLYRNKCEFTTDLSQDNKYIQFTKVKQENVGTSYRPHNYYWKHKIALENEDMSKRKYFEKVKEIDSNLLNLEKRIKEEVSKGLSNKL